MLILFNIIIFIIGYIIGSFNTSLVYTKWIKKNDIRKKGSGNAGATNFARINSFSSGVLISFLDWTKVVFLTVIIWSIKHLYFFAYSKNIWIQFVALGCFFGHVWPIFFKFKGGKGASSFLGIVISFNVIAGIVIIFLFWIVVWITDKISIGVIFVGYVAIILSFIPWFNNGVLTTMMNDIPYWVSPSMFSLIAIALTLLHYQNIKRLINKKENSFRKTVLNKKKHK